MVLVDQLPDSIRGQVSGGDLALVEEAAQRITQARGAFRADQFRLAGNFRAHYLHTGPDFWQQAGEQIDVFCDFPGTGGSFAGCAAAFKERNANIRCYVVEPAGAGRPCRTAHHQPKSSHSGRWLCDIRPPTPSRQPCGRLFAGDGCRSDSGYTTIGSRGRHLCRVLIRGECCRGPTSIGRRGTRPHACCSDQ